MLRRPCYHRANSVPQSCHAVGSRRSGTIHERVFQDPEQTGLWMVVPFEEQAYQLDARYTRNPSDIFSVEDEVRQWMQEGRY